MIERFRVLVGHPGVGQAAAVADVLSQSPVSVQLRQHNWFFFLYDYLLLSCIKVERNHSTGIDSQENRIGTREKTASTVSVGQESQKAEMG